MMMKQLRCSTEKLIKAIDKPFCRHPILMGDFNAKIKVRSVNDNMKYVVAFGIGNKNKRGERALDFAEENNLVTAYSLFQKAATDTGQGKPQDV